MVKILSRADIKIFLAAIYRAVLLGNAEKIERFMGSGDGGEGSSARRLPVVGTGFLRQIVIIRRPGDYDFSTIPTGRHRRNGGA